MKNADFVMNQSFWIGVFPGLTTELLDFVVKVITEFVANAKAGLRVVEEAVAG